MIRPALGPLLAACLTGTAIGAEPVDLEVSASVQALSAMQRGDYAVAYCAWRPLAAAGNAEAQYALGWMYHNGYGLVIDDREAEAWWRRAAEQGHVEAMFSLGTLYSLGSETVQQDFAAAMRAWVEAAAAGHGHSQTALRQLIGRADEEVERAALELLTERPRVFGEALAVKSARANVRRGPGMGHRVLAVVSNGAPLVEFLRIDDWVKVGVLGDTPRVGWIHHDLIGETPRLAADGERSGNADPQSLRVRQ